MSVIVHRRKKGTTYQVRVRDHFGKWYPSPSFKTKEEALTEEARLLSLKCRGTSAVSEDARTVTVRDYWEVWSVENRPEASDGWKISQNQMYRDYIDPVLGDLPMGRVGAPEIGRVLNRMREIGRGDQLRLHVYSLLRSMFNDAIEYYGMLVASPVKPKFHRPKVVMKKRKFLHPSDAWVLLKSVRDSYLGPAIWLQTLAALRVSEVQGLRWSAVSFKLNQILICEAYNNKTKQMQDYPKQEEWAYVPMTPALKEYLLPMRGAPDAFVAAGPKGGMLSYNTYIRALKRECRLAGVSEIATHELRHTSTEIWIQAGATQEDIRRLLNHASDQSTKHYIHRTDGRLNALSGKIRAPLWLVPSGDVPGLVPEMEQKGVCAGGAGAYEVGN